MRKIKLLVASSLDNYIARLNGDFDWILMDQDYGLKDFFATADTVLMGRKMYDLMRPIGMRAYKDMTNYVFSYTKAESSQDEVHFVSENKQEFVPQASWQSR
ncbi:MAG: hypothetical protein M3Y24_10010 [Acidobacteriota bacterium]|nr:hypothetical protein [Acidobacteriota bacterium]